MEHATTGEGDEEKGEVSAEFAYLDFKPWKRVGLRAGLLLLPMGFTNELHEAPVFHGARRPAVETAIIPSTWRENGAGVFGETGPVQWRAYVVAGLSSRGFAAGGIREGRQGGSNSLAEDVAVAARADYTGISGLLAGGSLFTGESGQGAIEVALAGAVMLCVNFAIATGIVELVMDAQPVVPLIKRELLARASAAALMIVGVSGSAIVRSTTMAGGSAQE